MLNIKKKKVAVRVCNIFNKKVTDSKHSNFISTFVFLIVQLDSNIYLKIMPKKTVIKIYQIRNFQNSLFKNYKNLFSFFSFNLLF